MAIAAKIAGDVITYGNSTGCEERQPEAEALLAEKLQAYNIYLYRAGVWLLAADVE
ncbi:MAG: hypothetical protein BroJett011_42810 [Chloroflexota bacterium]|nr:MAG: hypothetical protein BroJett011_42810 [Chloroflexota bacterium]